MSGVVLERSEARGGQLACVCDVAPPATTEPATSSNGNDLVPLAIANGFTVLAQTLTLSVIPIAGVTLAPNSALSALPYGALLAGAGLATLPAAYLTMGLDRRFGFALGASLGLAGACLAAWGVGVAHFPALVLGAFWLGLAQGFGAFYRHGAATRTSGRARAIGIVIGAGAVAALIAPAMVEAARALAGPLLPAALIFGAGVAHLGTLAADFALPPSPLQATSRRDVASGDRTAQNAGFLRATLAGSLAWFIMAALMGGTPVRMLDCGIDLQGSAGLISWHILAMYGPALIAGRLVQPRLRGLTLGIGLLCAAAGAAVAMFASSGPIFAVAFLLGGFGWSLSMVVATNLLHAQGTPKRHLLALHDALLLAAAIAGAAAGSLVH
jgi:hypothetical protein